MQSGKVSTLAVPCITRKLTVHVEGDWGWRLDGGNKSRNCQVELTGKSCHKSIPCEPECGGKHGCVLFRLVLMLLKLSQRCFGHSAWAPSRKQRILLLLH